MLKHKLALAIGVLALSACQVYHLNKRLTDAERSQYGGIGTASIAGQAFLVTRGGDVKYGAARKVNLYPAVPYVYEALIHFNTLDSATQAQVRAELAPLTRTVVGDGLGHFKFEKLPAGDYYVECRIFWEVARPYHTETTGSTILKLVSVGEGDRVDDVMITNEL